MQEIKWLAKPQKHDYPAAASYLHLICNEAAAGRLIKGLKAAEMTAFRAKDIFRASALALLGPDNYHVQKDRELIIAGNRLSPILLVRDTVNGRLIIADGYHRLCAVYSFDEDAMIPCKITS